MSLFKFQPFATDKNISREYNGHCELVPAEADWILIMDFDAMILSHKTYQVIENAIKNYPETLIFGAMTNRVGYSFQRLLPAQDENDSIKYHIQIAEQLADQYPNGEYEKANQCAGFFMLFRKSYWLKNKFQDRIMDTTGNLFDWKFARSAGKVDGGIKILKGVYVFHQYRITKDWKDKSHLRG